MGVDIIKKRIASYKNVMVDKIMFFVMKVVQ